MEYWMLTSLIIQMLLGMGLANNHDRELSGNEFLTLKYSIDIRTPESIIGATFYNENILLVYSLRVLAIIDLSNKTQTVYKFVDDFHPRKLMNGFTDNELLLLSPGRHCIRKLTLSTSQVTTFSGNCIRPGFVDGDAKQAKYNLPSDMERTGDYFLVADYNNDCVRRLWNDGYVQKVLSIHSKPFELSGNLYVAAHQTIYKIRDSLNTYVRFVEDVNATTLESCTSDMISMLSADKCLKLLPTSRDVSVHPATINNSFDGLICHQNVPMVAKYIYTDSNRTTMQLYTVDDQRATGIYRTTVTLETTNATTPATNTTPSTTTTATTSTNTTTTQRSITTPVRRTQSTIISSKKDSITPTVATVAMTTLGKPISTNHTLHQNFSKVTESFLSSNASNYSTEGYMPEQPPAPLHNHAHDQFAHLPSSYTEENKSWSVILPVILAIATVLAVLVTLAIILYKRSNKLNLNLNEEEGSEDEEDGNDLREYSTPHIGSAYIDSSRIDSTHVDPTQSLLQFTSLNGCHLYNERVTKKNFKSNGNLRGFVPLSNGAKVPRPSNGNGVARPARLVNGNSFANGDTTAL